MSAFLSQDIRNTQGISANTSIKITPDITCKIPGYCIISNMYKKTKKILKEMGHSFTYLTNVSIQNGCLLF